MNNYLIIVLSIGLFCFVLLNILCNQWYYKKYKILSISINNAVFWSIFWVCLTILFLLIFWLILVKNVGLDLANFKIITFISAYLFEKFLSIDNICIWFFIFKYFSIPLIYQKTVLTYGILGTIVFRTLIAFFGNILLLKYKWILYFFGVFVFLGGMKIIFYKDSKDVILKKKWLVFLQNFFRITDELKGDKFFVKKNDCLFATPLFISLIVIECMDMCFAIDSTSAVLSVTSDPFIIIFSNIFAILGLRSFYFLLALNFNKIKSIKYGLSIIFIFTGIKMLMINYIYLSTELTLLILIFIISMTILYSFFLDSKNK
ncbi:MAG: TerC family protein [Buchnera aphidicola (Eriosoma harunire)]